MLQSLLTSKLSISKLTIFLSIKVYYLYSSINFTRKKLSERYPTMQDAGSREGPSPQKNPKNSQKKKLIN